MAKLIINLDLIFQTNPLLVHDKESFEDISLDGRRGKAFFEKIPSNELTFEVISTNEDAELSFPFALNNGKKGAIFNVEMIRDGESLETKISGDFLIDLRSGVGPLLKKFGENLDLRIRGVMWKGGSYNGFMAYIKGSYFGQESQNWIDTFPKVEIFMVK
jgi:hypothetical protein